MNTIERPYEALVVGAGPGGIDAVGCLLERNVTPIMWIDDSFNGGRINQAYREVPCNTKVKLITDFATALSSFRDILEVGTQQNEHRKALSSTKAADAFHTLQQHDPEGFCGLSCPADLLVELTKGLRQSQDVNSIQGRVHQASLQADDSVWDIKVMSGNSLEEICIRAKRLVFCLGSAPICRQHPPALAVAPHIPLDVALAPSLLSAKLASQNSNTTVGVVGASHSAILVLKNLSNLAASSGGRLRVVWFTHRELQYAEWVDGKYVRDNTGLKGEVSEWARRNLETPEGLQRNSVTKVAYDIDDEAEKFRAHLVGVDWVVQAVGFAPNPLPTLSVSSQPGMLKQLCFDHDTGRYHYLLPGSGAEKFLVGERVPNLYGAGIACSKRIRDSIQGHWEYNVGFRGFLVAVKSWLEDWLEDGLTEQQLEKRKICPTDRRFSIHLSL